MRSQKSWFVKGSSDTTLSEDYFELPLQVGRDSSLIKTLHYYNSLPQFPLPATADVSLMGIFKTGALGLAHIVDVSSENPDGFKFQVYGNKCTLNGGRDFTDRFVGEVPFEKYRTFVASSYEKVKQLGKPLFSDVRTRQLSYTRRYRRLMLPLTDDSRDVTHVLVACTIDEIDIAL